MSRTKNLSAVGIIAEYNPFHNGHAYHIKRARELTSADFCVVVMSGDFVQRGCPAIFDKYTRANMALLSGADLVLELPPAFAVSSAEDFAACGIAVLEQLQVISHVCFGSECGAIEPLWKIGEILSKEPEIFRTTLKESIRLGLTFPEARVKALKTLMEQGETVQNIAEEPASLLSMPNNILGVEYCKALLKRNSSIIPVTIKRQGNDYHDITCDISGENENCFSSALALRNAIKNAHNPRSSPLESILKQQIPQPAQELIKNATPLFPEDFSSLLSYRILELMEQNIDLQLFGDISKELAARIKRQSLDFSSFEERIQNLKTRQYTYTRISRSLLHLLLHITKEDLISRKSHDYISYFRVLGFRKEAAPLLKEIKKAAQPPLITKTADAAKRLNENALNEFYKDLFCSHVYQAVMEQKSKVHVKNEYIQSLIIL